MTYFLTVLGAVISLSSPVSLSYTSPTLQDLEMCEAAKERALSEISVIPGASAVAFCTEVGDRQQGSPGRIDVESNLNQ